MKDLSYDANGIAIRLNPDRHVAIAVIENGLVLKSVLNNDEIHTIQVQISAPFRDVEDGRIYEEFFHPVRIGRIERWEPLLHFDNIAALIGRYVMSAYSQKRTLR